MSRTITVTGGFSGAATVDLTDSLKNLDDASFRLALTPVGDDDPPAIDDDAWAAAEVASRTAGSVALSLVVDDSTDLGYYNLAYDVVLDGRHEAAWVMDKSNRRRRALVVVT